MNKFTFSFAGSELSALASGGLFWPAQDLLVVSDLHFGKAARFSAVGGSALPPYETRETLTRLEKDLSETGARQVICLGDSFDAPGIETALPEDDLLWISRLMAGRRWTWIAGNHDPAPLGLAGSHRSEMSVGPLVFRHIAKAGATGEVSGHYHPKARITARGRAISRPCFLIDEARLILPAYGHFTGGLWSDSTVLCALMAPEARAILTGKTLFEIPMPRRAMA
ncbi:ligase-associated DNA damage response endonuclease PdeM [Thalassococcus sp. CAU 1522]|uniref:Ligase-associated DNA damage response endonuclease PdeM n=1 Tax=Thalassococcus arenae TaxID=2851652 RepID=A0ABS6N476_9RHOB|nr:ligase-associated DNA damage response endonuclease PdeM [Thalassococcus arenae]MBV2358814.1 ligase-associated DNA damage response endonuclease PdeM [Thalassococcus arenae]